MDDELNKAARHRHGAGWDANGSPVDDALEVRPLQVADRWWLIGVTCACLAFWAAVIAWVVW